MCWICDSEVKSIVADGFVRRLLATQTHDTAKLTDAYDTTGGLTTQMIGTTAPLLLTADTAPADTSTTVTVTVNGPSIIATIDTIGDQDFYKVELEAGRIYDIGQYLVTGGPSGIPLSDAFLEIYDSTGKLLTSADGGGPNTPSGLDALLTFIPKETGTYYINARAYDQDATNGSTGDEIGDYELFVTDVTGRPSYTPYYDIDGPLHSLDWGSQVDRTSRNPDGAEGPRVTGNAFQAAPNAFGIEGKNVITVYYAKAGDVFVAEDPANPGLTSTMVAKGLQAWEKDAFELAFNLYEQVADVVFVEVNNRAEADFKIITYNGTPGAGASLLGRFSPPNELNEGQGEFNSGDVRWTEEGLQQGGFYFPTLLHELGHGMGMAHPHDNGGRSSIMRGAGGGTGGIGGGYGDFELSQQVFTVMSYNDGWDKSGYGNPRSGGITGTQVDHFGWVGTLSPLDIAVMQDKYGVNEEWAAGDDVYTIKDYNGAGNYYAAIWDGGGTDEIRYEGAREATIDLRAATLKYEEGGGGRVSHAFGLFGGYTIANGVTIENASGGSGNDKLFGNDAANVLLGNAGDDAIDGGAGNDTIVGGAGKDALTGGAGSDVFRYTATSDSGTGTARDVIGDFQEGDQIDLTAVGANTFVGGALFSGRAGEVRAVSITDQTIIEVDTNGDRLADMQIELNGAYVLDRLDFVGLNGTATEGADTLYGSGGNDSMRSLGGNDVLLGYAGNDSLDGGAGNDLIVGGAGRDTMTGGLGADKFRFESTGDSGANSADKILDFQSGVDKIDLSGLDDGGLAFIGKKAFSGRGDEVRFTKTNTGTFVEVDLDGDTVADMQIEFAGSLNLLATDFIF
jgi:Ca2+-binding RTX toxin-like protein